MSVFKNLLKASFRGIEFLTPDESKVGGKKTVTHEYAGSEKRRFVEELGSQSPTYSITAIIHGADAIQKRINFENELDKAGRGLLIHPTYGQIMVVATDYNSSSSDTAIGKFTFSITFKESEENITLTATADSVNLVSNIADQAKAALDLSFIAKYINIKTPFILQASAAQFTGVTTTLGGLAGSLEDVIPANLTDFNSIADIAENIAPTIVREATSFIGEVRSLYNAYENVSGSISGYYDGYMDLTTFGGNRLQKALTTVKRISEEVNLSAFEDVTRINSLISSYEAASYRDYNTDIELNDTKLELETAYDYIIENSDDDGLIFDPDLKSIVNDLRVSTRNVFEQKQQIAWRVVDIQPDECSIALATHRYYGNLENIETIANLNPDVNFSQSDVDLKGIS